MKNTSVEEYNNNSKSVILDLSFGITIKNKYIGGFLPTQFEIKKLMYLLLHIVMGNGWVLDFIMNRKKFNYDENIFNTLISIYVFIGICSR